MCDIQPSGYNGEGQRVARTHFTNQHLATCMCTYQQGGEVGLAVKSTLKQAPNSSIILCSKTGSFSKVAEYCWQLNH